MEYRKLGRTGFMVSAIGLGLEHLKGKPRETMVAVIHEAIEQGLNYFDVVFSFSEFLDNAGSAFRGYRERVILTGHLGSTEKDGQYHKTHNVKKSEIFFHEVLQRIGTDYVDVLFLHNFNSLKEYDAILRPKGLLELAYRLCKEGKAHYIGISTHNANVALKAVEDGYVDVVMFPIHLASYAAPGRKEMLAVCVAHSIGVVAMKPFAGGKLLSGERTLRLAGYHTGHRATRFRMTQAITPVQCMHYTLSQPGVSLALIGCENVEQLTAALAYWQATDEERDFLPIMTDFQQYVDGECVYCNHCLPCPMRIDIGQVNRLLDIAQQRMTKELQATYAAFPIKASACIQCGACEDRCPFNVSVIDRMKQAVSVFE